MTEPETVISDEQLLDLWLTAWVAGAVDLAMSEADPETQRHIHGCAECTKRAIDTYSARLVAMWEDPVARDAVIEVSRKVLVHESAEPRFVAVHTPNTEGHR